MSLDTVIEALRQARCEPRRNGKGWRAKCPAHDDSKPSLSINLGREGVVVINCFAGCKLDEVLSALHLKKRDLFNNRPVSRPMRAREGPGLTIQAYANAKWLDPELLHRIGLKDTTWAGRPAILIPYRDPAGVVVGTRLRTALDGDARFRWKPGSTVIPYGLWRLTEIQAGRSVALVEGESDFHTLHYQRLPVLALPGATSWRETWATYFDGIETIHLVVEPDRGGTALLNSLECSKLRERVRLVHLPTKDVSALYLRDPRGDFRRPWEESLARAVPLQRTTAAQWALVNRLAGPPYNGTAAPYDLSRNGPRRFHGRAWVAEAALNELVAGGFGRWDVSTPGLKGGRPSKRFVLEGGFRVQPPCVVHVETSPKVTGRLSTETPSSPETGGFLWAPGVRYVIEAGRSIEAPGADPVLERFKSVMAAAAKSRRRRPPPDLLRRRRELPARLAAAFGPTFGEPPGRQEPDAGDQRRAS